MASTPDLRGAHVVITGATRGIGRALADEMAARGARLSLVGRDGTALAEVARATDGAPVLADLTDLEQVATVLTRAREVNGPVNVLVNNAAVNLPGPLAHCDRRQLQDRLITNFVTPMELTRDALQDMLPARRGAVVTVSSLIGEMAVRNVIPYGASKAGINMATRALRRELAGTGVVAQLALLGAVHTRMYDEDTFLDPVAGQSAARLGKLSPMTPEQAAHALAEFVTRGGEVLVLPRFARPLPGLRFLPTRFADLLLAGIPRSHR
jgi:short-subunit dehydrogenase